MTLLLLRRLKEVGRKRTALVPCSITLFNACFGFLAVLAATRQEYAVAAVCIVIAAIMDMLDGRLARILGSVTVIGMELDSLSDAISFCMAPAMLFYCWWNEYEPVQGLVVALIYLAAGLVRLARFNAVESGINTTFRGLPTPAAALAVVALIMHYAPTFMASRLVACSMLCLAILMVSSVPFPSCKRSSSWLLCSVLCGGTIGSIGLFYYQWPLPFTALCVVSSYIGLGIVQGCWRILMRF